MTAGSIIKAGSKESPLKFKALNFLIEFLPLMLVHV